MTMKDAIISQLTTGNEEISPRALELILMRHLGPVINDAHFRIGFSNLGRGHFISVLPRASTLSYEITPNGFRNVETGLYLESVEGHEINEIMRLHANAQGELFYRPVLQGDRLFGQVIFTYENGEDIPRQFQLFREPQRTFTPPLPTLEFREGIPIITVRVMGADGHEDAFFYEHAVAFLSFAELVRDEPAVIVDVRSNSGGNSLLPTRWFYALTGEIVPSNLTQLGTGGADGRELENMMESHPLQEGYAEYFANFRQLDENHSISFDFPRRIVYREQIIIVLTDRATVSAGEAFTDLTTNMSNALIIGSPTSGTLAFSGRADVKLLPNSGLNFAFGRGKLLWDDNHFAENIGIQPDIWTDGIALDVALGLLRGVGFMD